LRREIQILRDSRLSDLESASIALASSGLLDSCERAWRQERLTKDKFWEWCIDGAQISLVLQLDGRSAFSGS
jgi:hypothetical protein